MKKNSILKLILILLIIPLMFLSIKKESSEEEIYKITDIDSFYQYSLLDNYKDIRDIEVGYTLEDFAGEDIYYKDSEKEYNKELLEEFESNYNNKEDAVLRLIDDKINDILYKADEDLFYVVIDNRSNNFLNEDLREVTLTTYKNMSNYDTGKNTYLAIYNDEEDVLLISLIG